MNLFIANLVVLFSLFGKNTYAKSDNPENWCRWGSVKVDNFYTVGTLKSKNENKFYFYNDQDQCPDLSIQKCKNKSYLISGDKVLLANQYKDWTCARYLNFSKKKIISDTSGWILTKFISIEKTLNHPKEDSWLGKWVDGFNTLELTKGSDGQIKVNGLATWGSGVNMHTGEIVGMGKPIENKITVKDESNEDCQLKLVLIDQFLIAEDNSNCGGVNVSFSSVYIREK